MPTRILRDWTHSARVDALEWQEEVLFTRLIMKADDFGRFSANPKLLRSLCFPLRDGIREADITRWLAACQKAGLLRLYTSADKPLLQIEDFGQRTRTPSKYDPPPDDSGACPSNVSKARTNDGLGECVVGGVVGGECGDAHDSDDAVIPTPIEVVKLGKGSTPAIPEEYCRTFHAKHSEKHNWLSHGRLVDWKSQLRRYWAADSRTWRPSDANGKKPDARCKV